MDTLAVAEDYRGKGIGTALLNNIFMYAADNNLKTAVLEVVNTNPRAKKLYEKMGFRAQKENKYGFITKIAGFTSEYVMVKDI